jgi:hypothetical protein
MEVFISPDFSIMETGTALLMNEISGRNCGLIVPSLRSQWLNAASSEQRL